ncbi:non-specific serine/threonine protein kinase [Ranunculus cassubicifolius]
MRSIIIILHLFFVAHFFRSTAEFTEKEILLQFKGNISDDPLKILNSWSLTGNPCQDYNGVYCNPVGNVERIVLWNTSLAGVLSPSLSSLKALRILTLYGNQFTGNVPVEFAEMGNIWKMNLSSNALSGEIPGFLGEYRNLRFLDLSRNRYTGGIPGAIFKNCIKTKFISLSHNSLSGSIPMSIVNCLNLIGFDVSYNNLSGSFPSQICLLPSIAYVSLRSNSLVGDVSREDVLKCQSLELFDVGSNFFTGVAPFDVVGMVNVSYFNASFNQFEGLIPEIGVCSDRMEVFDVSGNRLSGELPSSITNCESLRVLDLGSNQITGGIPSGIGSLRELSVIRLGSNLIGGTIPAELGNVELLQVLDLHNMELVGEIPEELSKCRFLLELDLSGNNLQGEIPQTLNNMTYLYILDLHRNRFSGDIPVTLGELSRIQVLDLSENMLSGMIPSSLGNLIRLTHFNLSTNNLAGAIPYSSTIQGFGATAFLNNPELCGDPLERACSANGISSSRGTRGLSVSAIVAIVAAAVIVFGVCIICVLNVRARKRRRDELSLVSESTPPASTQSNPIIGKLVLFSKTLPSKYEDWEAGTKALLDKECLVGGGSIGTVYRTSFEGGIFIAVKKLETLGRIRSQDEFEQEIGRLANLVHPNLVAFQGYYWSSTMQLILSEFVPNGNLYQHLHGLIYSGASASTSSRRSDLDWIRRFRIALGTAKALAYLHHDCKPQVLHLNIKSTNILLDENFEPKVSDYGLIKLLPMLDNYGLTKFHTAVGYIAPELATQSLRFSDKSDVFSFGVILLELVTGRKPVESPAASEVVILCDFVRVLLENGTASDCFDRSLRGFAENELIQVMKLGLICTSEAPSRRPNMAEVVQVLESIRSN